MVTVSSSTINITQGTSRIKVTVSSSTIKVKAGTI